MIEVGTRYVHILGVSGPGPAITLQVRDRDKVMEPYTLCRI